MEFCRKTFGELTKEELYEILQLRSAVFVVEQNCPYQDLDGNDQAALHLFFRESGAITAYLRIMDRDVVSPYVSIGRVIAVHRRRGEATRLLTEAIRAAREHFRADRIYLEAQVYARALYEKLGFRQISEEFLEDGIPHIRMLLDCTD